MGEGPDAEPTVVFDLDGVLYLDSEGIPGAGDALEAIAAMGWRMLFATNNSTKTPDLVAEHILARTGFAASGADAVTSAGSAARYVAEHHTTAHVVGSPAIATMLHEAGVATPNTDQPGAVVVGLDRDLSYSTIDKASRLIRDGAEFVATNIDSTYPTPTGLSPGAGTIVAAIREASGVDAVNCGKPTAIFMDLVHEKLGTDHAVAERPDAPEPCVWMVGDRAETDIAMAKVGGWTSVLTLSGVTASPESVPREYRPDHVISTVADLPDLLRQSAGGTLRGG
ncbi:MAG: HAD-IIA family hydrolase [Acidimicrobiia bacterium]